jgi:hypothetical protein
MRAIECWLKGGRKSKGQAIRDAGYPESIAQQPHKVFGSPAVQRELDKRGYGPDGLGNNLEPLKSIDIVPPEPVPSYSFNKLRAVDIELLRERLEEIGYNPWVKSQLEEESSIASVGTKVESNLFSRNQNNIKNLTSYSSM